MTPPMIAPVLLVGGLEVSVMVALPVKSADAEVAEVDVNEADDEGAVEDADAGEMDGDVDDADVNEVVEKVLGIEVAAGMAVAKLEDVGVDVGSESVVNAASKWSVSAVAPQAI
jgi:hypothetical protein